MKIAISKQNLPENFFHNQQSTPQLKYSIQKHYDGSKIIIIKEFYRTFSFSSKKKVCIDI